MINTTTTAIIAGGAAISPVVIVFIGGVICTALGAPAMYWPAYRRGYKVADAKGDKFWAMQQEIKAKNALEAWHKASKASYKGHETRRAARKLIEPLTGTEGRR